MGERTQVGVYPLRCAVDAKIGSDLIQDGVRAVECLSGCLVDIVWKSGEKPSRTSILAVGKCNDILILCAFLNVAHCLSRERTTGHIHPTPELPVPVVHAAALNYSRTKEK